MAIACTLWQTYLLLRRPLRIVPLRLNLTPGYFGELPVGALPQVLMHLLCQITLLRRAFSKCRQIAAVITEDANQRFGYMLKRCRHPVHADRPLGIFVWR